METPEIAVTSGVELAKSIGCGIDEGVVVALLPEKIENVHSQEIPYLDKKGDHCHIIIADCGPWGRRALDVQSPNDEQMKWWKVKEAASIAGVQLLPTRWEGPIGEIPSRYFEAARAGEPDPVVAIRFWQHGPFFFPREKPVVTNEGETQLSEALEVVKDSLVAGA